MGFKKYLCSALLASALSLPFVPTANAGTSRIITPNRDIRDHSYVDLYREPRLELPKKAIDFDLNVSYSRKMGDFDTVEYVNEMVDRATSGEYINTSDVVDILADVQETIDESEEIFTFFSQKADVEFSLFFPTDTLLRLGVGIDTNTEIYVNMPGEDVVDLDDAPISPWGISISEDEPFRDVLYLLSFAAHYLKDESPSRKVFEYYTMNDITIQFDVAQKFELPNDVNLGFHFDLDTRVREYLDQEFTIPQIEGLDDAMGITLNPQRNFNGPIVNVSLGSFLYLPKIYGRPFFSVNAYDFVSTPLKNETDTLLQDPFVLELGLFASPIDTPVGNLESLTFGFFVSTPFVQEEVYEQYRLTGMFKYHPINQVEIEGELTKTNMLERVMIGAGVNIPTPIGAYLNTGVRFQHEKRKFPFTETEIPVESFMFNATLGWDTYHIRAHLDKQKK